MKNTILKVFSTNILSAGLGFLLMVILSKYLSVSDFGKINYVISIIMILYALYDFGAVNTIVIFYNKFNKELNNNALKILNIFFKRYIFFIFFISIISGFVLDYLSNLEILEIIIITLNSLLLFIVKFMQAIFQAKGKWNTYNNITLINNLIKITIISFAAYVAAEKYLYDSILYAYGLYIILLFGYVLFKSFKYLEIDNKIKMQNYRILKIMIPIGLINVVLILIQRGDILLIERYLDQHQLGLYSIANQLAMIFPIIATAMSIVFLKQASENDKIYFKEKIIKKQKYLILPSFFILLIVTIFAEDIIRIIYDVKYIESKYILIILLYIQIIGIFFTAIESYTFVHYQQKYLIIKLIQLFLFILISIILVERFNLIGILIAMGISKIFSWIVTTILVVKSK